MCVWHVKELASLGEAGSRSNFLLAFTWLATASVRRRSKRQPQKNKNKNPLLFFFVFCFLNFGQRMSQTGKIGKLINYK